MHVATQQMQGIFSSENCLMTIFLSMLNIIPNLSEFDWPSGYLVNGLHDYDYINLYHKCPTGQFFDPFITFLFRLHFDLVR